MSKGVILGCVLRLKADKSHVKLEILSWTLWERQFWQSSVCFFVGKGKVAILSPKERI